MGKYKLFFLLMIFLCISCGNNKISIRVESALISSSDNQPLRSLTLENDSLLFTYQISLKDGYVGLSSIVSVSAMQPCPYFFISLPLLRE